MPDSTETKPLLLVFPFGLLSHYLRCIVLCRYLRPYFDIRILSNISFASFIDQEKFDTFQCESIDAASAVQSVKNFDFAWLNEFELNRTYLDEVRVINKLKPIAVLGDQTSTLKMAAEATGVPFISLLNGYFTKYYAGHRSISRTHPIYSLVKMLPQPLEKMLTKQGEATLFRQIHKPFKKLREKYNLKSQSQYQDEFEGDLTLVCDLVELFPQKQNPENYRPIAPLFYGWSLLESDHPAWLDTSKKTIYASMGSTGDWQKIAFLNDPFFSQYNIVAAADHARVLSAPHITHLPFVDIHELFRFTDLVICHGGNGTIYQSLLYEIPVLCKTSHCEQEWNIAAVEANQLGKNLDVISGPLEYCDAVQEWIQKKGNKQLKHFSSQIKLQLRQLSSRAKQVSDIILKKNGASRNMTQLSDTR